MLPSSPRAGLAALVALVVLPALGLPACAGPADTGVAVPVKDGANPLSAGDRLIVRYRDGPTDGSTPAPITPERFARLDAEARRLGVTLQVLRPTALGGHVLQLSAPLPPERLEALITVLRRADPALDYVEADRRMQRQ